MSPVRSDNLGYAERTSAGTTTMFTVPAGETWVVKWIITAGPTAGVPLLWQLVDGSANAINAEIISVTTSPGAIGREVWWALDAGSVLKLTTSVAGTMRGMAFGAKLVGVAP